MFSLKVHGTDLVVLKKVQRRETDHMNDALLATHTADDVKKVVQSVVNLKAPEPDGLHAIFYKKILAPFR